MLFFIKVAGAPIRDGAGPPAPPGPSACPPPGVDESRRRSGTATRGVPSASPAGCRDALSVGGIPLGGRLLASVLGIHPLLYRPDPPRRIGTPGADTVPEGGPRLRSRLCSERTICPVVCAISTELITSECDVRSRHLCLSLFGRWGWW